MDHEGKEGLGCESVAEAACGRRHFEESAMVGPVTSNA